jgi:hypothetical protein
MIERFSAPKNEGCNIFSMFPMYLVFQLKKYFDVF